MKFILRLYSVVLRLGTRIITASKFVQFGIWNLKIGIFAFRYYFENKEDGTMPNFFLNENEKCDKSSKPTLI